MLSRGSKRPCPNNGLPVLPTRAMCPRSGGPVGVRNRKGCIMTHPRRSLLFMPGSNSRALEKARILAADCIILDIEDSVAPEAKGLARDQIAKAISAGGFGRREVWIRTNAPDSPWWGDDIAMAAKARPDGILVPKISSVEDLGVIAHCLGDAGAEPS